LSQTNHTQLFYVGHSEGTTQAFAGFTNKTLASQVKLFVALAPVAYVGDLTSKFLQTLATLRVDTILEILGFNHFLINSCWLDNLIDCM
jgi:lysosomal acid lipase/cholesteryl ester hydrolase